MSASNRGAGQRQVFRLFKRWIACAAEPLITDFKIAIARFKAQRAEKRRMANLEALNDHTLRDIGLLRDRFTGTILNDVSGEVLDVETRQAYDAGEVTPGGFGPAHLNMIERRQSDRRRAERRFLVRRSGAESGAPDARQGYSAQGYSAGDRRAFDRRASDHRVLDCRRVFSGRPRLLLA